MKATKTTNFMDKTFHTKTNSATILSSSKGNIVF
jgi:hypothetical protein